MTDDTYTAIQILVDRSGSMETIQSDAEGALAAFIKEQTILPGKATIRLAEFDTLYDLVYPSTAVQDAPAYHLVPRGGTALLDAITRSINDFGTELAALPEQERPGHVLFVIITDGEENSSKEASSASVKLLVERQQDQWQWNFVFLAANQDAVLTGHQYGFQPGSAMTFNTSGAGVANTARTLNAYAAATRGGGSYQFTDKDRIAAMEDDER